MGPNTERRPLETVPTVQERRLGGTVLKTYRDRVDLSLVVPNDRQPRLGNQPDGEFQRQIEHNAGVFEPLLVEPNPDNGRQFRIIDGERRWTNSRALVEQGREQYRQIPVEINDRTLPEEERFKVWIAIHTQRKEWDAREKESVAARLVELSGRAGAANMLGLSMRELDKLLYVHDLSRRFIKLRDPKAAIAWARELAGVNKQLLTPSAIDAVVQKVNEQRITNSKDLRQLRTILRDPVSRDHFLSNDGDIRSSLLRLAPAADSAEPNSVESQLDVLAQSIRDSSWADINRIRENPEVLKKLDALMHLLGSVRGG